MRLAEVILALAILAPRAAPHEPTASGQQGRSNPSQLCELQGTVISAATGLPVKKAQVWAYQVSGRRLPNNQAHSAIADNNGHFLISNLEPGGYSLSASANGYPQQLFGQRAPGTRGKILTLDPGSHFRGIDFRLVPGGVITGTVYDEDGAPVVNAYVQAMRPSFPGSRQIAMTGGAQTNDLGQYRIFGLIPGRYYVVAGFQNRLAQTGANDGIYLPTYYPNTNDPAQATPVQVGGGEEVSEINVNLMRTHGVRVSGQVQASSSVKPLAGWYLQLVPRQTQLMASLGRYAGNVRDDKGNFEIDGVPPGSYSLVGQWNDRNTSYFGSVPVEVQNADIEGITILVSPGKELRGRIRTDPGATLDFTELNIWLQPADNLNLGGTNAEIKPDGTFVIRDVYSTNYRLHIGGFPEEFYPKSAKIEGLAALASGLDGSLAQGDATLDIYLSANGGRIDGTVIKHQKPVAGALVVYVPDPPNRNREDLYSEKITDPLGKFSLLGLPPSDFKLFAWESADGVAFRDPDFIKNYESQGTRVHVEEKQTQYLQLELIPLAENSEP